MKYKLGKIILLIISLAFFGLISTSVTFAADEIYYEWVNSISTSAYDYNGLSSLDSENNTIVVGYLYGDEIVIDKSTNDTYTCTNTCLYINKIDENGEIIWFKFVETSADGDLWPNDIYISPDDNIYISGAFYDSVDFDTGVSEDIRTSVPGDYDGFLLKLLSNGDYAWTITLDGNSYEEIYSSVEYDGYVYLTTEFYGTEIDMDPGLGEDIQENPNEFGHSAVGKYSATNATFVWGRSLGTVPLGATEGNIYADYLEVDVDGNLYLSGKFNADMDFDWGVGEDLITNAGYSVFLMQFDADANINWIEEIEKTNVTDIKYLSEIDELLLYGPYYEGVPNQYTFYVKTFGVEGAISQDYSFSYPLSSRFAFHSDGSFFVSGRLQSAIDWDPGDGELLQASPTSITGFIAQFDSNHGFVNVELLPLYYPNLINSLTDEDLSLYGFYSGSIDFDSGDGVEINTAGTSNDAFIVKYDKTAQDSLIYKNVVQIQEYENDGAIVMDSAKDDDGNIYMVGYFEGTNDLDFTAGEDIFSNSEDNNFEVFLSKYNSDSEYMWSKIIVGEYSNCTAEPDSVVIDSNDNIYVSGQFGRYFAPGVYSTCDCDPGSGESLISVISGKRGAYVNKFSSDGDLLWVSSNDETSWGFDGLDLNSSESKLFTSGSKIEGLSSFMTVYEVDASSGSLTELFSNSVESSLSRILKVKVNSDDDIYVAGGFSGTIDFDPGIGVENKTSAVGAGFAAKYNSDYQLDWVRIIEDASINDMTLDAESNIYLSGGYGNDDAVVNFAADFAEMPYNDTYPNFCSVGDETCFNPFVTRINYDGTYGWTSAFGRDDEEDDISSAKSISIGVYNSNPVLAIGGYITGTDIDLNSNSGNNIESASGTHRSPWFSLLNLDGGYIAGKVLSEVLVFPLTVAPLDITIDDNQVDFIHYRTYFEGDPLEQHIDHTSLFWRRYEIDDEAPNLSGMQVESIYSVPSPSFTGTATDTLSAISSVLFTVYSDPVSGSCEADDGDFDSLEEDFTCDLSEPLPVGSHSVEFTVTDFWGNISGVYEYDFTISSCGDGDLNLGEECDDGNTANGDGCSSLCELEPYCGDGDLDLGEECDDGNQINGDGCSNICEVESEEYYCGDGDVNDGEECDDGNQSNGDGCSSVCLDEETPSGSVCGNGIVETGEECDVMIMK